MKYMFFDTALNGYYTLTVLGKAFPGYKPLIAPQEKILDDVAPFVFEVNTDKLSELAQNSLISLKKIIVIETAESLAAVQNYFTQFVVQTIKGRPFYFRFWAADVFKKYIKTCDAKQLKEFFGPVQQFICHDDDPAFAVVFSFNGRSLVKDRIAADAVFGTGAEAKAEATAAVESKSTQTEERNNADVQEEKRQPRRYFY